MLVTVESMRSPDSSDYIMPAFDEDIVVGPKMNMTVRMTRDQVYPTMVIRPIKIAEHPVSIVGAFGPSVVQRASGLNISDDFNVTGMHTFIRCIWDAFL